MIELNSFFQGMIAGVLLGFILAGWSLEGEARRGRGK